ncbi:MAG: adenosylmethionine--8-amino-7-oxononanoate transaminase [Methylacidiphilales bacterium]|nr:adenosylmethionine--8-amino-7-oxononanoate transaminase [Candidatus Methylacidiphilales bacterium]
MTLSDLDKQYLWHPFTPSERWLDPAFEPIVITEGEGSWLIDEKGEKYLDGNSSIWTNLHGHRHPKINAAIKKQLDRIAHSSFLGLTNDLAPGLAEQLIGLASTPKDSLARCFFSDDGSTAIEAALKIVYQYFQQNGQPERKTFVSLGSAYHGDTTGAMSVGHSPLFHHSYRGMLFPAEEVMSPYCYRCPFNTAKPEKHDARACRKCNWECVDLVENKFEELGGSSAAWVIEPRVQGAAGFIMHPEGYLEKTSRIAQSHGAKVILDEVMTGFDRTGSPFAFQKENVQPDLVALAKGLSGGYLPLAATLVTEELFEGFRGDSTRTFFHGHSYTGNALGCAAALASLEILQSPECKVRQQALEQVLKKSHDLFWQLEYVGDVRQEGCILAIELVQDFQIRRAFDPARRVGVEVCRHAAEHGLLTRPVGDVLLLMPPYSTTESEAQQMIDALYKAIQSTFNHG